MLKTLVCGIMWTVGITSTSMVAFALTTKDVDAFFLVTLALYAIKFIHFLVNRRVKEEKVEVEKKVEEVKEEVTVEEDTKVEIEQPKKTKDIGKAFFSRLIKVLTRLSIIAGIIGYIIDNGGVTEEGVFLFIGFTLILLLPYIVLRMTPEENRDKVTLFGLICGILIARDIVKRSTRR